MSRLAGLLIFTSIFATACSFNGSSPEPAVQTNSSDQTGGDKNRQPPFSSKEPEKYQAEIVFAYKWNDSDSALIEQTTFVARDGQNRRLDFETGGGKQVSSLETADGKRFLLVPHRKIYAEISQPASEILTDAAPEDYSLSHLLYAKPPEAKFLKVGAETIDGKQLTKYLVDYGAVRQDEDAKTETIIWIDENLGLPVKTEIAAIVDKKLSGAKSIVELRDLKTDVEPQVFAVPAGFRKVTPKEIQDIIKPR